MRVNGAKVRSYCRSDRHMGRTRGSMLGVSGSGNAGITLSFRVKVL